MDVKSIVGIALVVIILGGMMFVIFHNRRK